MSMKITTEDKIKLVTAINNLVGFQTADGRRRTNWKRVHKSLLTQGFTFAKKGKAGVKYVQGFYYNYRHLVVGDAPHHVVTATSVTQQRVKEANAENYLNIVGSVINSGLPSRKKLALVRAAVQ